MLQVQQLCKSYGNARVLDHVSFTMQSQEIVSIVGSSGEGKSTIARILCGTVKPDEGQVLFGDNTLLTSNMSFNQKYRTDIQLIPQQPFASLDPRQTIGQAICEPLLFHKLVNCKEAAKVRAKELMEQVLLAPGLYDRRPGELSGGQAQRVLIARSLTVSPKLLIADEATSMLDVTSQAQVIRILQQLVSQNALSILLISHDQLLVSSVSNRIYQLSSGRLSEIK